MDNVPKECGFFESYILVENDILSQKFCHEKLIFRGYYIKCLGIVLISLYIFFIQNYVRYIH